MISDIEDKFLSFITRNQFAEKELNRVENDFNISIRSNLNAIDPEFERYLYLFDEDAKREAGKMAFYYEIWYCLEQYLRRIVSENLEEVYGDEWWNERAPDGVKTSVKQSIKKEMDSGISLRSSENIDFANFGELGEIVKANWDIFGGIFRNDKAFMSVMHRLNTMRNYIAHCSVMTEKEIGRFKLAIDDFFHLQSHA